MNRTVRWLRNGLALLLLLALAAGAAWLIAQSRPRPPQPAGSPLPTPTPVRSPTPTQRALQATPTSKALPAPTGTSSPIFPTSTPPGISPSSYMFGEPQVVLTHTTGIRIAGWLPDSRRLLISRDIPKGGGEVIETFDIQTKDIQRYGKRIPSDAKPVWLIAAGRPAWGELTSDRRWVLRIGSPDPGDGEIVASDLESMYLAANTGGQQILFFAKSDRERPQVFDSIEKRSHLAPFVIPATPPQPRPLSPWLSPYRAVWQPDDTRVAIYNGAAFYVADLSTGRVQAIDLGQRAEYGNYWVLYAVWSPNGRYLALIVAAGDMGQVYREELRMLDLTTGAVTVIGKEIPNPSETAWAPDSQHLVVLGWPGPERPTDVRAGLYLVDTRIGSVQRVLPDWLFSLADYSIQGGGLSWSSGGENLVVACAIWAKTEPLITEGRLCLIPVSTGR